MKRPLILIFIILSLVAMGFYFFKKYNLTETPVKIDEKLLPFVNSGKLDKVLASDISNGRVIEAFVGIKYDDIYRLYPNSEERNLKMKERENQILTEIAGNYDVIEIYKYSNIVFLRIYDVDSLLKFINHPQVIFIKANRALKLQ